MKRVSLLALFCTFVLPANLFSQGGVSSSSVGVARAGFHHVDPSGYYRMPQPDMFRVEEFVNYHRHNLALPQPGKRVRLDTQHLKLENGQSILQIGLTTPRAQKSSDLPPLNLVLVVDESGSMSGKKHEQLQQSLRCFVERFRKTDRIAIIGFEEEARVILEPSEKTKIKKIYKAIDQIHATGSTNLHAGLMSGYRMALKHFDPERTNRVIFLTDGNANVGTTESEEIARESKACIKRGISLITIGLGVDFNHGLLRELADSGRSTMHYVGDAEDIKKTFVDEFDSVLAPAASNVKLTVSIDHPESPNFFGYEQQIKRPSRKRAYTSSGHGSQQFIFKLDDLNYGATQVVLSQIDQTKGRLRGTATLSYVDAISKEKITLTRQLDSKEEPSRSAVKSIKRNYAIATVADSIRSAAKASNDGNNGLAKKRLKKGLQKARKICVNHEDESLLRVVNIATKYRKMLADK